MTPAWSHGWVLNHSPYEAARQLEHDNPGWQIWVGAFTGHFLALHHTVPHLITTRTPTEMAAKITTSQRGNVPLEMTRAHGRF